MKKDNQVSKSPKESVLGTLQAQGVIGTISDGWNHAENHLDGILHKIAHRAWEKELVTKRLKPHTVNFVKI